MNSFIEAITTNMKLTFLTPIQEIMMFVARNIVRPTIGTMATLTVNGFSVALKQGKEYKSNYVQYVRGLIHRNYQTHYYHLPGSIENIKHIIIIYPAGEFHIRRHRRRPLN